LYRNLLIYKDLWIYNDLTLGGGHMAKFRQEHRYVLADIGGELAARRTAFYADLAGRIAALSEGGAAW
jgi:hypothetical protein